LRAKVSRSIRCRSGTVSQVAGALKGGDHETDVVTAGRRKCHEPVAGGFVRAMRAFRSGVSAARDVRSVARAVTGVRVDQLEQLPAGPRRKLCLWLVHRVVLGTALQRLCSSRQATCVKTTLCDPRDYTCVALLT